MNDESVDVAVVGSLNIDRTLDVPSIPSAGETLLADRSVVGLGGKGANQAVAASRAGASVAFIGCVGSDGDRWTAMLAADGVDTGGVTVTDTATGAAFIAVSSDGENSIIVDPAANKHLSPVDVRASLESTRPTVLLTQLEVPIDAVAAALDFEDSTRMVNAAPFDPAIVELLDDVDVLIVNETEHHMLLAAGGSIDTLIVTRGADGLDVTVDGDTTHVPARRVDPVDTTGAGDTFCGYLAAGVAAGHSITEAAIVAAHAAAIATTRPGASASIPQRFEL